MLYRIDTKTIQAIQNTNALQWQSPQQGFTFIPLHDEVRKHKQSTKIRRLNVPIFVLS